MEVFYVLILLLVVQTILFDLNRKEGKIAYLILSFLEFQLFSGLRVPAYGDSQYYTDLFVEISKTPFIDLFESNLEKGFVFFCYILSFISKRPQTLIFFSSLIMNVLVIYYIYRKSKMVWLSVILYVTFMYFFNGMNLMRFVLAYTILLYANDYVVKRQFLKFSTILLIAASFHFSVLMYYIIYLIYPLKLCKKNLLIIAIPFSLLSITFMSAFEILIQLNDRYTSYESGGEFYQSAYANILEFLISLSIFVFVVWNNKRILHRLQGDDKLFTWMLFVAAIFALMSINVMIIIRFVSLFSLISIIFIPNLISQMPFGKKHIWITIFLVISTLKMVVVLTYRPEWYFGEPYKNWLF